MSDCRSCTYWSKDRMAKDVGDCRRRPPTIVPSLAILDAPNGTSAEIDPAGIHFATRFPITHFSEGCGEWDSGVPL